MKMESKYKIGDMVYAINYVNEGEYVEIWKDQIESISYDSNGIGYWLMNHDFNIYEDFVCTDKDVNSKILKILKNMKEPEKTLSTQIDGEI